MKSLNVKIASFRSREVPSVDELLSLIDQLSLDDRSLLLNQLLDKQSGSKLVFGNNQLLGFIIVQINTMNKDQLGDLLNAIADRISN
jgi:hypothetical protein